jgi:signal transduction histidine kinase
MLDSKNPPEWESGKIQSILDSCDRMDRLVSELLELSKEERTPSKAEEIDFAEYAVLLARRLRPLAEKTGIELAFSGTGFPIAASESDLDKVFSNLIKNAFLHSGSKRVECVFGNGTATVRDFGHGIPKKELSEIWKRFYRSEKARSTEGFGLGLSIVRKVADREGWKISVKSEVGKGTEFIVRFS